ncbi:MAG: VPLPA-CTERM sorting domain-containing protein [Pseudomonadota bacterium]
MTNFVPGAFADTDGLAPVLAEDAGNNQVAAQSLSEMVILDDGTGNGITVFGFGGNEAGSGGSVIVLRDIEVSVYDNATGTATSVWRNQGDVTINLDGNLGANRTDILLSIPEFLLVDTRFTPDDLVVFSWTVLESNGGPDSWGYVNAFDCDGVGGTNCFRTGAVVPLPPTAALMLAGLGGLAATAMRRRGSAA